MKKIADMIIKEVKGHNANMDLIKAFVRVAIEASPFDFTEQERAEIMTDVLYGLRDDFNPFSEPNQF